MSELVIPDLFVNPGFDRGWTAAFHHESVRDLLPQRSSVAVSTVGDCSMETPTDLDEPQIRVLDLEKQVFDVC